MTLRLQILTQKLLGNAASALLLALTPYGRQLVAMAARREEHLAGLASVGFSEDDREILLRHATVMNDATLIHAWQIFATSALSPEDVTVILLGLPPERVGYNLMLPVHLQDWQADARDPEIRATAAYMRAHLLKILPMSLTSNQLETPE